MKNLAMALTVIAGAAVAAPMDPVLDAGGSWHGVGIQTGEIHWPLEVTLSADTSAIRYPSFGCEGAWVPLNVTDRGLIAIERIDIGLDTCSNGGVVRVSVLDEDRLSYVWFDAAGEPAAKAILVPGPFREELYDALLEMTVSGLDMGFLERQNAVEEAPEL